MECPVCGSQMRRVGLESLQFGKLVVEFECTQCHWRVSQPIKKA